jgi:CubicO group peptidase (beta-lactamase class C family)
VDLITFGDLLAHTSGLSYESGSSRSDFPYMKSQIAAGTFNRGQYYYQNMNYGLCRILLATINGNIPVDWTAPPFLFNLFGSEFNDRLWDVITIRAYAAYVANCVFAPAGVTGPGFTHEAADALAYAYDFPVTGTGWNSGDLTSMAGGAAWHMSVNELLSVMGTFRRGGSIVTAAQAQAMLDDGFGQNPQIAQTPLGPVYHKIGTWGTDSDRWEQGVAFFLPLNMELVVLVNSTVGGIQDGQYLYTLVSNAFLAHIVELPVPPVGP